MDWSLNMYGNRVSVRFHHLDDVSCCVMGVKQCQKPSPSHQYFYRWYGYHSKSWVVYGIVLPTLLTLWLFDITMENGPFIDDKHDDLPIQNGDVP